MTLEEQECFMCGYPVMEKRVHVIAKNPYDGIDFVLTNEFPISVALLTCPKCKHREVIRCNGIKSEVCKKQNVVTE